MIQLILTTLAAYVLMHYTLTSFKVDEGMTKISSVVFAVVVLLIQLTVL